MTPPIDTEQLRSLTDSLLWMSEADYPFEVFCWEGINELTSEAVCEKTGHSPDTSIETIGIDKFFKPAVTSQDWHNENEKAEVRRYQELLSFLKNNLEDIQVYRVGKIEIDVYIVGQCSGQLIGLKTKVVET